MVRLNSGKGWCGTSTEPGTNWVLIDLKAPTIVRGFRTQSVMRPDGNLAFTSAVRIQVTRILKNITTIMRAYYCGHIGPVHD
jgi:hypothetical protein